MNIEDAKQLLLDHIYAVITEFAAGTTMEADEAKAEADAAMALVSALNLLQPRASGEKPSTAEFIKQKNVFHDATKTVHGHQFVDERHDGSVRITRHVLGRDEC